MPATLPDRDFPAETGGAQDNPHVLSRAALLVALSVLAGLGLAACGGSGSQLVVPPTTSTTTVDRNGNTVAVGGPALSSNTPMTRLLLSGRLKPPAGFTLQSVNPLVPTTQANYGAVSAILTSPTGVVYNVVFSPPTVPCTSNCVTARKTVVVGSANPSPSGAIFAPEVGMSAECGYDPDGHQVGCDTIVSDEYVSVRATSGNVSTADAVTVLRAAIAYVQSLQ
jgi:hypothetical protein